MKKTFLLAGIASFLLTLAVYAQEPQPTQPTQPQPTTQEKKHPNPTVDSILSKYTLVPMPSQMTTEQIFPVIGQYQSSTNADQKITVTLDDQNKGFVWIDGLPEGKIKGVMKRSPATYKIPAQKTAEGNDVREGTLIYDKDSKVITVMLGRPFNDQDPASVFATTTVEPAAEMPVTKTKTNKTKTKVKKVAPPFVFTGTKVEQVTATNQ
jgi:hypothetical protein